MLKNVSGQKIGAQLITSADGTAFTGSVTVAVTVDAGTQATGSVGSGACTHEGGGYHTYAPAQAETNGDLVAFTFSGTGAISTTVQVYTRPTTGLLAPSVLGRTLVVDASGLADANTVKVGPSGSGTAQTARDIGASVLLSSGTGTGQVKLSGGYVAPNWGDVGNPTTSLNLSGTTIATTQKVDVETIKNQAVTCAAGVTVYPAVGMTATARTNLETVYATDFVTNYNTTADMWNVNVSKWAGTAVSLSDSSLPRVSTYDVYDQAGGNYFSLRVEANGAVFITGINTANFSDTASQCAAAFSTMFNVSSPVFKFTR